MPKEKVLFFEPRSYSGGIVNTVHPHDFRIESSFII